MRLGDYRKKPVKVFYDEFKALYLDFAGLNKSPRTVLDDKRFLKILEEELHPRDLSDVTAQKIEQLKLTRQKKKNSPTTINMMLRHLSSVFSFAVVQNYLSENPFKQVKS